MKTKRRLYKLYFIIFAFIFLISINFVFSLESAIFSNDGKYFAVGEQKNDGPGTILIFETKTWTPFLNLSSSGTGHVMELKFTPDDEYLIETNSERGVYIYSTKNWSLMVNKTSSSKYAEFADITYDERYLVLSNYYRGDDEEYPEPYSEVFYFSNLSHIVTFFNPGRPVVAKFSKNGKYLATNTEKGNVTIYNTDNWQIEHTFDRGGFGFALCWSKDNNYLFYGGEKPSELDVMWVGNWSSKGLGADNNGKVSEIQKVKYCDVGEKSKRVAVVGHGGGAVVEIGGEWKTLQKFEIEKGMAVDFSNDEKFLGFSTLGHMVYVYDYDTYKKVYEANTSDLKFPRLNNNKEINFLWLILLFILFFIFILAKSYIHFKNKN